MKKPNISEFSDDCRVIGVAMRRVCFASNQLPVDEVHKARTECDTALMKFANKYGMHVDTARTFAEVISDSVSLGLAY